MNSEFLAGVLKVWQSFRFFWCLFCGTICVFVFFLGGMTVWLQNILLTHSPWPKLGPRCCRRPKHSWKSTVQMRNFRFKTLSFPYKWKSGQRHHDDEGSNGWAKPTRFGNWFKINLFNCCKCRLPETWGSRPQHASNFKASCEHCWTTIGFSKWFQTISQYAMYQTPFTYPSPQINHICRTGRARKWEKKHLHQFMIYITLPPSVIEVKVNKFPWKRKFLISFEH